VSSLRRMWMWRWLPRRIGSQRAGQLPGRLRHQCQLCNTPGCDGPRKNVRLHWVLPLALGICSRPPSRNEVYSDLTGERGILMGRTGGRMEAQYNTLRSHGHSPSEAFNETVEELTQSLIRLVGQNGMDGCMQIVQPPPNAARWIGRTGSATQSRLYSMIYIRAW